MCRMPLKYLATWEDKQGTSTPEGKNKSSLKKKKKSSFLLLLFLFSGKL